MSQYHSSTELYRYRPRTRSTSISSWYPFQPPPDLLQQSLTVTIPPPPPKWQPYLTIGWTWMQSTAPFPAATYSAWYCLNPPICRPIHQYWYPTAPLYRSIAPETGTTHRSHYLPGSQQSHEAYVVRHHPPHLPSITENRACVDEHRLESRNPSGNGLLFSTHQYKRKNQDYADSTAKRAKVNMDRSPAPRPVQTLITHSSASGRIPKTTVRTTRSTHYGLTAGAADVDEKVSVTPESKHILDLIATAKQLEHINGPDSARGRFYCGVARLVEGMEDAEDADGVELEREFMGASDEMKVKIEEC